MRVRVHAMILAHPFFFASYSFSLSVSRLLLSYARFIFAVSERTPFIMSIFTDNKPTLTYFDLYGKGEAIRMALVHSKTDFVDSRVSGESWAAFKASGKCNNGQVPVLEVAGENLNQSEAILRFVGSQTGAYDTSDPFAMWAADAVINTTGDFDKSGPKNAGGRPLYTSMFSDSPLSEEDVTKISDHRVKYWAGLQVLLGDKTYFGGEKMSIADFWVGASLFSWEKNTKGKEAQQHVYAAHAKALGGNPVMTAWADRMAVEFADYLATRRPGTI